MNNEKSKKVTYEIETNDSLKISRKVEQSNRPRIDIKLDDADRLGIFALVLVWMLFKLLIALG